MGEERVRDPVEGEHRGHRANDDPFGPTTENQPEDDRSHHKYSDDASDHASQSSRWWDRSSDQP